MGRWNSMTKSQPDPKRVVEQAREVHFTIRQSRLEIYFTQAQDAPSRLINHSEVSQVGTPPNIPTPPTTPVGGPLNTPRRSNLRHRSIFSRRSKKLAEPLRGTKNLDKPFGSGTDNAKEFAVIENGSIEARYWADVA